MDAIEEYGFDTTELKKIKYIHYDDLIVNKLAAGRRKDLVDDEKLRQVKKAETDKEEQDNTSVTSDRLQTSLWKRIKKAIFPRSD